MEEKMKRFLLTFLLLSLGLACMGEGKEQSKPQFKAWAIRTQEKGKVKAEQRTIIISPTKKEVMASVNAIFPIKAFDKVTLSAMFKGKGTIKMGFHVYSPKKYLTTFDGYKILKYSPDKFTKIEYTHYVPSDDGKYKPMIKAVPCVYFYPGTQGEFKDFQWKIEKFSLDKDSPLSKTPPAKNILPMARQLTLPEAIYAVTDVKCNIYFDNVFLSPKSSDYRFNVKCAKGKTDSDKWSFIPGDSDKGSYDLTLSVTDKNGKLVAEKKAKLFVAPKNAGKGKEYSLLMFGDSIIGVTTFPKRVHALFQTPENPRLVMIGNRPRKGLKKGSMVHEGFPGWSWYYFTHNGPFVVKKNGYPVKLDVKGYFAKNNGGKAPDFITIQLGVNDVFGRDDFRLPSAMAAMEGYMDKLIAELRKSAPNAVIGIAYPTPASKNKNLVNPRHKKAVWRYRKNLSELNYRMQKRFPLNGKNPRKIFLIPVGTALDCVNNFPVKDFVHPSPAGGDQLGDALYAFLKYQMSIKK